MNLAAAASFRPLHGAYHSLAVSALQSRQQACQAGSALPSSSRSDSARKECQPPGKDHLCSGAKYGGQPLAPRPRRVSPQAQAGAPGRGALRTAASWRPSTATCGCPGRGPIGAGSHCCCRARRTAAPRIAEAAWPHPGHTDCCGPRPAARSFTGPHLAACQAPCLPWHRSHLRPPLLQLPPRPGRARAGAVRRAGAAPPAPEQQQGGGAGAAVSRANVRRHVRGAWGRRARCWEPRARPRGDS